MKDKKPQPFEGKQEDGNSMDIAVIGMACRFPGAENYREFWENLNNSKSCIQEIPLERWDWRAYWGDPKTGENKTNSKWGGFIENADAFEAAFFNISARQAEVMDPQQRIMLELSWNCLEDAGVCPSDISGSKVGVFIGVFNHDYKELQEKVFSSIEAYHSTGTASAVISNRISHYFNFNGPSFPIDAACSSSLNAIHSAIQSLYLGECSMALAGGVSLLLTPTRHISFSKTGMLSPTGSCKTFDDSADGYVRSEGAGLILLKPLKKAVADGDLIYGVIKGSAVNHNGRTHTLTYPNPDAQAAVIVDACRRAGIEPDSISYIEAHGTGTPKGDPIEFAGLVKAFGSFPSKEGQPARKNYCGLGSVKTNIGHLESAAGIAGVIKVLLSMKHKQLPGLQNYKKLNHRILLDDSPFYIVDKPQVWKALRGEDNRTIPRRAGVSSFGFGGTNAHVILEEAPAAIRHTSEKLPSYLICLSARTEESLRKKEEELAAWLKKHGQENSLIDISANLLLFREHFEMRSAFVVKDIEELQEKLKKSLSNEEPKELSKTNSQTNRENLKAILRELGKTIMKELSYNSIKNEQEYGDKLTALAEMYTEGHELSWEELYSNHTIRRINLPVYPFVGERYWIANNAAYKDSITQNHAAAALIHPMLHQNTSDFSEQRFSSTFTGQEFFLSDHIVNNQRLLPGVAYLEMVQAALSQAAGYLKNSGVRVRLKNVIWVKPIAVGAQPVRVHVGLFPESAEQAAFEIYSNIDGTDMEPVVNSQGIAVLDRMVEVETLDLPTIKQQCKLKSLSAAECYKAFKGMGIDYGPGHRGIEKVYKGEEQLLAKLSLPDFLAHTAAKYVLHPSLMDSSLQAAVVLAAELACENADMPDRPFVPFALDELEIISSCTSVMWVLVRYGNDFRMGDKLRKVDLDLCSEAGNVCVRMRGLSLKALGNETGGKKSITPDTRLILKPCWKEQNVCEGAAEPVYDEHVVIICEPDKTVYQSIETELDGARCITLYSKKREIDGRFQAYAVQLFEEIRSRFEEKPKGRILIQTVIAADNEKKLLSGLSGILRTAHIENPNIICQLIELEPGETLKGVAEKLKDNSRCPADDQIRYIGGKRFVAGWSEVELFEDSDIPWKNRGVYLITGGTGGLGLIFAKEILSKAKDVVLVLTGRSGLDAHKQSLLKELQDMGTVVEYREVDVAGKKPVANLIRSICEKYGSLDGIIHSAGIIQDNLILKKTKDELQNVLMPKVTGLVNLDQASKDLKLDFFVLFSSVSGSLGNLGQADYSAANAFMDAYAVYRNNLVAVKERQGRTLSINWPLWKDGGMKVAEESVGMMWQNMRASAMSTSTGIHAFYQGLASGEDQILVIEGDSKRLRERFMEKPGNPEGTTALSVMQINRPNPVIRHDSLCEKAEKYLKRIISSVIKLPDDRIEVNAPMERYGIDSIMIMQLTNQLEIIFGSLPKTLFFEYQNIKELTGYFLENYADKLTELLENEKKILTTDENCNDSYDRTEKPDMTLKSYKRHRFAAIQNILQDKKTADNGEIAIIGLAGRYPGAESIFEFWQNLKEGRDCITEIPKNRWDYRLYYDEDRSKPGKTYSKWGGFLKGIDRFDPLFFNISPREAEYMDPQERLFLECAFETFEDAGYTREVRGKNGDMGKSRNTGVFVGVMYEEYQLYGAQEMLQGRPAAYWGIPASIANRVSYFFNFHGPSMAVDTMCSSSLTAIHLACQSIQRNECEIAIAGGVNVSVHPNKYLFLSQNRFVSSKGRCESFGQGGDGYVPGEGVGAVLIKPLSKAVKDGDHIYGIIKGTAINHGGKTNGYTVPNPNAQAEVIGRAFKEAGISPRSISYIEAHGTGTSLGDPIEIAGLTKAFQKYTRDKQFCTIGSAKSNIGHCESAAGIAGLTKVLLQLKYRQLVPSLHSEILNPNIDFINTPFVVQQEIEEWKKPVIGGNEVPRRAGISSFGAGGANAHIVVEEYIPAVPEQPKIVINTQNPAIIVLSAKNEEKLKEQAERLSDAIVRQQFSDNSLADMAYTLQVGREAMEERMAVTALSVKELEEKLKSFAGGKGAIEGLFRGQVKRNKDSLSVFEADEDMEGIIDAWIKKGKYAKLLELWVKGLDFDWDKLYGKTKPCRISLPAYPFARELCWKPRVDMGVPGRNIAEDSFSGRKMCFLKKRWELSEAGQSREVDSCVAIIATKETMELAGELSEYFPEIEILEIFEPDKKLQNKEYEWKKYDGCIDLTGCGKDGSEDETWILWLQQLIEHGRKEKVTLLCVTKGLESYQNTGINLSGASRAGLYRMLQSEYSHLRTRHMDADPCADNKILARHIAFEYFADSEDIEICYRREKRYRAFLNEIQLRADKKSRFAFSKDYVLWITGGTRGIGYLCAKHFVEYYGVKRLVLTGREELPPREQWGFYREKDTPLSQKIESIQKLEEQGVQVQILQVSLADKIALQQSLQGIRQTMGPVGGIIHCAGIGDFENPAFIRKSVDRVKQVLEPKTTALDVILQCFKDEPLQFFALFSSVSAVIPTLASGQSDYAMANAYMDYFAEANAFSCPVVSIQWPSWKETGMGEVKSKAYMYTGLLSMTDKEGLQLLDSVLSNELGPVILPAVINPDLWKPHLLMNRKIHEDIPAGTRLYTLHSAKTPKISDDLTGAIKNWLTGLFARELKVDSHRLDADTPFQDYGVDSIMLAQLLPPIKQMVGEEIDPSILYEYPTIEAFAQWLSCKHAHILAKTLDILPVRQDTIEKQDYQRAGQSASKEVRKDVEAGKLKIKTGMQDIAVIGMSCRFPGAGTVEEYLKLLREGRTVIRPVPLERWGHLSNFHAGMLDNITHFDPSFFLIHDEDARVMDPQALMVLEESLRLWHNAGYSHKEIKGKPVGVYLGARSQHQPDRLSLRKARNPIVGVGKNYLAANISHFFDLRGPSIVLDTACSSALVGINIAAQALCCGEIECAIVGGISLLTTDEFHRIFEQRKILSREPVFHIFDQRVSGVVLGEGVGMVLLKTVEQAVADGDHIYAIIKAAAVNNDGRTAGPATPNIQAQKDVMMAALTKSRRRPEEVGYIEANGSGSEVTDLLELKAIQAVYRSSSSTSLGVGSVKPNIGHLLCAEGIAGFIKVVLMLYHGQKFPFLSGKRPMKNYEFDVSFIDFSRDLSTWSDAARIAAVSSFADGGTNAHVILEAWANTELQRVVRHPIPSPVLEKYMVYQTEEAFRPENGKDCTGENSKGGKHAVMVGDINNTTTNVKEQERALKSLHSTNSIWKQSYTADEE